MTAVRLVAALVAFATCVTIVACGGDGGATKPTSTASRRVTPTEEGSPTPGDGKSTPIDESPVQTATPGGETPTPPSPAAEGIKATLVADESAYLAQFIGRDVREEACQYNPVTRITDCSGTKYAIDPPFVAQDISCSRGFVDGQAEYIHCTSAEPEQSKFYEIQA